MNIIEGVKAPEPVELGEQWRHPVTENIYMTMRNDDGILFWKLIYIDGVQPPKPERGLIWHHPTNGKVYVAIIRPGTSFWDEAPYIPEPPTTNQNGNAGKWSFEVSRGGYPVWGKLFYEGKKIAHGIHHKDLRDLQYTINRAILAARDELATDYKHEMD